MHSFAVRRFLIAVAGLTLCIGSEAVLAQDTNLAVYQRLAQECLAELPADIDSLALEAPAEMPYLRSALVETWKSAGYEVYDVGDTPPQAATLPRLAFSIEDAHVTYGVSGRRRLSRDVTLALQYSLMDVDGRIILDERCSRSADDIIDRATRARLENQVYAETVGAEPRAGWIRRYVEPAVLAAATALGVYLFFTLRSQSADD
jgi:hypothetical protein